MAADGTAKVGHQSKSQALQVGAAFKSRTDRPEHFCDTGLCYIGHGNLFPCRCDDLIAKLPD